MNGVANASKRFKIALLLSQYIINKLFSIIHSALKVVHSTVILLMDISSNGLSFLSVFASSMASTLSKPPTARPNTLKHYVLGSNKSANL